MIEEENMKRILIILMFFPLLLIILNLDCLKKELIREKEVTGGEIIEKYYIGQYSEGYLTLKDNLIYISIPKTGLMTFDISTKNIKTISSNNYILSSKGITKYKDSFVVLYNDKNFNIAKTNDFINYNTYFCDISNDVGNIYDIEYLDNYDYFVCIAKNIKEYLYTSNSNGIIKFIYDQTNDGFIYKGKDENFNYINVSYSNIFLTMISSNDNYFITSDCFWALDYIYTFRIYDINLKKLEKEITIKNTEAGWGICDLCYDGKYLYLLTSDGDMYIEKMEIK